MEEAPTIITNTPSSPSIITHLPSPRGEAGRAPPTPSPRGPPPRPPPSSSTPAASCQENRSKIYVVQVPKDQIYHVPPPENAILAERRRTNHEIKRKQRNPFLHSLCWLLAGLLLAGIVVAISGVLLFVLVRPGVPSFAVDRLLVTSSSQNMSYNFTMRSKNSRIRMGLLYERGGKATLSYEDEEIARGGTPEFYQSLKSVTEFELILDGNSIAWPRDIKRSLNGSKEVLPFSLSIICPVRLKVSELKLWRMRMGVKCDVKASGLGKGTRVVSQMCKAKLQV